MSNNSVWVAPRLGTERAQRQDLVGQLLGCHERIHRFVAMARKVASSSGAPAEQVQEACEGINRYFRIALPLHVADEEESLYPRLIGRCPEVDRALESMVEQHSQHESALDRFCETVDAVAANPGDSRQRLDLLHATETLERFFVDHLGLEESTIFPAIGQSLSQQQQDDIAREIRSRRGPATD